MESELAQFTSRRSTTYANRGMVATSQPLAASAGVSILERGGNAFDAAVTTAATLAVVEPMSTGLGGDLFALYRTSEGDVGALSACGSAPADATIDRVRAALATETELSIHYSDASDRTIDEDDITMPSTGPHTVTVPGTARGWETTVETLGTMAFSEVLEPAIHYAKAGYPVSEVIASSWQNARSVFVDDRGRDAYLTDGRAPVSAQTVTLDQLGTTLQRLADEGADPVYEGDIAHAIADEVQSRGGFMTVDDLAAFEPAFVDPISTTYNGVEVYELPPNNQGLIVLEALNIAEEIGAGAHPYDSPARVHAFAEAMKLAFVDGHHYITDSRFETVPPLATKAYARARSSAIGERAIRDASIGVPSANGEDADTVLLTVADEAGNLVSFINSCFGHFGTGLVAGETGIALQNRGASFSLDPDHPNSLEPGKRPFHTLIPALARFGADDWAAFGVMGGYMQPQGHVQVISNLVDYELTPQAALDAPRWRYREDGTLAVEERLPGQTELARMGHDVRILPPQQFGGGQLVRRRGEVIAGATDPRKDGTAYGY